MHMYMLYMKHGVRTGRAAGRRNVRLEPCPAARSGPVLLAVLDLEGADAGTGSTLGFER